MARLSVLSKQEAKAFDEPPIFDSVERKRFYDLTVGLNAVIATLRTPANKVLFLVSYAYFKTRKRFYDGGFREKDLQYACVMLAIDYSSIQHDCVYDYKTKIDHQRKILALTGYSDFYDSDHEALAAFVYLQVKCYKSPRVIFIEMSDYLLARKIALPRYRQFVNLISDQVQRYKLAIHDCLADCLDAQTKSQLDALLSQDDKHYSLRSLKRYNQSLRPSNIRENLEDFKRIKSLYALVEQPFKALELNHEGAIYLTRFVERNRLLHLSQRIDDTRHVSLIAFIAYQYFQGHDVLADIVLQSVQHVINGVNADLKSQRADNYTEQHHALRTLLLQTKAHLIDPLEQISKIAFNQDLSAEQGLQRIRELLSVRKQPIAECCHTLVEMNAKWQAFEHDRAYFSALENKSRPLQHRVSGIIKSVAFTGNPHLIAAITHFQSKEVIDHAAPVEFLSAKECDALTDDNGNFRVSLYKALLFLHIAQALKSGDLSLPYSYKYRHLDDYLISEQQWSLKREDYIKQAGLEQWLEIEQLLFNSEKELNASYKRINQLILHDKTPYITCRSDGSFQVKTPKLADKEMDSISQLLPHKKDIAIQDVLAIVNQQTRFSERLIQDAPRKQHNSPEQHSLFATLIAYGCNVGIARMARITKGQSQAILETIAGKYLHIDNIKQANDCILKCIDDIAQPFNLAKVRHTSSDGQKRNVDGDSLNANYSYKYHGAEQGVSSYIFLDDRFAHFYATVISSSEREACYVLDGIMNNAIIKSDIHSTDTHGFTEAVFALMHLVGVIFAPRLKNLSNQTLYGFKSSKINKNDFITPKKRLNIELIKQHWDDLLRFAATIKLRHASASQLFKRLNSYSKQHTLYKALKEFGRLQKTLFILNYMQDVSFRQAIEKQLNRGENSNKFSKTIAFGNNQDILFEEKEEQIIAENCRQLIKNAIILWNYLYLIKLLHADDPIKVQHALATLQKGNVLAWKHILLYGEYDFSPKENHDEFNLADPKIITLIHTKFWEAKIAS